MATVADRNAGPKISPEEKALLDRILKMPRARQQRIFRLVEACRTASSEGEEAEIVAALSEVVFGEAKDYTASELGSDDTRKGKDALARHRQYVGAQIRKFRQKLKMSQEELAAKAGLPQTHISRLENGLHAPTYLTIEKLAGALRVKQSQLDPGFND
jgi:ribosome-binding protein aMBF1 (putative translation factor)